VRHSQSSLLLSEPNQDRTVRQEQHLSFKGNESEGRHGWLRLTPAYSIHLVQDLVAGLSRHDVVLDPFCGTGTTALLCAQSGIVCDTVDINPFLIWLTSAKCARYSLADIGEAHSFVARLTADGLDGREAWSPPIKDIHKWWSAADLPALSGLFAHICEGSKEGCRDLLLVAFCRTAIGTAAVSFGHQSMSFRRSDSQPTLFDDEPSHRVLAHFRRAVSDVLRSAAEAPHGTVKAVLGDSRHLDRFLPSERYTAVITSPPYPNRMSYIRELRPYMYWLGHLRDGRQAGELDWEAIGGTWGCATSLVAKWEPDPRLKIGWPGLYGCIQDIKKHSDLLGRYVHKYFEDVALHIASLARVLAAGARLHYVVGNSKFYDVLVPTEEIFASLFSATGMSEVSIQRIRKRTSKKELFEFVVHARKGP
jgi:hypothetical protein